MPRGLEAAAGTGHWDQHPVQTRARRGELQSKLWVLPKWRLNSFRCLQIVAQPEVLLPPVEPRPWCWPALKGCPSQVLLGEPTQVPVQDPPTLHQTSKQMSSSPLQRTGAFVMSEAGRFTSRLKTALTLGVAGPPVPKLWDVPQG